MYNYRSLLISIVPIFLPPGLTAVCWKACHELPRAEGGTSILKSKTSQVVYRLQVVPGSLIVKSPKSTASGWVFVGFSRFPVDSPEFLHLYQIRQEWIFLSEYRRAQSARYQNQLVRLSVVNHRPFLPRTAARYPVSYTYVITVTKRRPHTTDARCKPLSGCRAMPALRRLRRHQPNTRRPTDTIYLFSTYAVVATPSTT
ncbi:hypothetical protein GE21DRAFT_1214634 [Neurospora crassa]|nr:hypothetical protein B14D6.380 [imported] - Neurospora crassa [Neurospora crassa]KHE81932.1 hypothetical protein GE21DRAFT_1214634 [Neurospora crassa]